MQYVSDGLMYVYLYIKELLDDDDTYYEGTPAVSLKSV